MHVTEREFEAKPIDRINPAYVSAILKDVVVEAHVGLHPWERHPERPTRLIVNIAMFAAWAGLPLDHPDAPLLDYDPVRAALQSWPARPHTKLLETLVEELFEVCFRNPAVAACRISIVKPDIFNNAAAVGVEAYRPR